MHITQNMSRKCIVTFFRICKLGLIKIKNKHLDFHWDYIHWGYSIFIKKQSTIAMMPYLFLLLYNKDNFWLFNIRSNCRIFRYIRP